MTVRLREWRDRKTGARKSHWEVHVVVRALDGREQKVRRKSPVQTKRGAEQYERQIRQALLDGSYGRKEVVERTIPTLKGISDEFIESYAKVHNKPNEVRSKEGNLRRYLLPEFGKRRLDEIRFRDIEKFKARMLSRGLNPKTVNNALATLSRLLCWAQEAEVIDQVPRLRHLPVRDNEFDYLTFAEAERLLEAARKTPEWYAMIFTALRTGLRYGELCELRWSDVDLVSGEMRVRRSFSFGEVTDRKNHTAYTLHLSPKTLAFLRCHRDSQGRVGKVVRLDGQEVEKATSRGVPASGLVFAKPDGGRHIHRRADVGLKRCCKRAGLRLIGWHVLRHTFGSHLAMRGRSLLEIKELMGHRDISSTLRYAHLMPEKKAEALAVLDAPAPFQESTGRATADFDADDANSGL